jgi:hypothetical protein
VSSEIADRDDVTTLRGHATTRRQVLKGGAAVGATLVWAVPAVEILSTRVASASSCSTSGGSGGNHKKTYLTSCVWLACKGQQSGEWHLWSCDNSGNTGKWQTSLPSCDQSSGDGWSNFDFPSTDCFTFPTNGQDYKGSFDEYGNCKITSDGTPTDYPLPCYVIVKGESTTDDGRILVCPSTDNSPYQNDQQLSTCSVPNGCQTTTLESDSWSKTFDLSYVVGTPI